MDREQFDVVGESRLVIGMDYDLPSLHKHKAIERLLVGDVSRLPFPDQTFDLVSANMVVEHLTDPAASLAEIRRILKPGGAFVFHTPNYRSPWVFLGSLAPDFLKVWLARVLEHRAAADVFPTRYRMNSAKAVQEHAERAGLRLESLEFASTSAGTGAFGPLAIFELLFLRLLRRRALRRFRTNLIGTMVKPVR
jgi:ubiquinone/menaquinone biosynthesis C-methylase UbiE